MNEYQGFYESRFVPKSYALLRFTPTYLAEG